MAIDWRPDGNGGAYRVRVSYKDGTGKRRHGCPGCGGSCEYLAQ